MADIASYIRIWISLPSVSYTAARYDSCHGYEAQGSLIVTTLPTWGAVDELYRTVPTSASRLITTTLRAGSANFSGARQACAQVPVELLTADQSTFWGKLPIWAAGLQPTPQGHKSQLALQDSPD
jgi:hypothetical protein